MDANLPSSSPERHYSSICIAGLGNSLRGDDGLGYYICEKLINLSLIGVEVVYFGHLTPESVLDLLEYDYVLLVDAAKGLQTFSLSPVDPLTAGSQFSHHLSASLIRDLTFHLFEKKVEFMVCAVGGTEFEFSEKISSYALANAGQAIAAILSWIHSINPGK